MRKLKIPYAIFNSRSIQVFFFIFSMSSVSLKTIAGDASTEFQNANNMYQRQQYDSAAKVFDQLISQDYRSPEVYFNLANCYYKLNNTPKAILNYERALKLQPGDEDAAFNLKVAQLRVVDKIEPVPLIFYKRWMKSISSALTIDSWARLLIINLWIMFIFSAVYILSRNASIKRTGFLLAAFFLFTSAITGVITNQNYSENMMHKSAVITSVSAYVKSSPGENNTDLFLLHEGTKVDILDTYDSWVKIRIANGSIGWLKNSDTEEI